mgnify:CR=1 FL=1
MKSSNIRKHPSLVSSDVRALKLRQSGVVVWFTGLSGSGKSTIAMAVEKQLIEHGVFTAVLDGDNLRHGLCGDLGFSKADRRENIRRVREVASLFYQTGLVTLCAFVSPIDEDRRALAQAFPEGDLILVYLATPLGVCEARDPKGLYEKARSGLIDDFTGIQAPYEAPKTPDLKFDTSILSVDEIATSICEVVLTKCRTAR